MVDSIDRFSNRIDNYIKYRPDYRREIIGFLCENAGLTSGSIVADVGCGPGISSRMFLEKGCTVIGVEPNVGMREAAESLLANYPNFSVIDGTSDTTTLPDRSVDMVVAAQAFHWFDAERTRPE